MAAGRREFQGLLTAWQATQMPFGPRGDPSQINPFRRRRAETPAMRELRRWKESRRLAAAGRIAARRAGQQQGA